MDNKKNEQNSKKPYEKPRLRIIELAAEEVLAAGCKTFGGGATVPVSPCDTGGCAGLGS